MKSLRFQWLTISASVLCYLFFVAPLIAQTNWTGLASTTAWGTAGNWSAGIPATGVTATFDGPGNGQVAIALGGVSRNMANLVFDTASAASYSFSTGTMNFDAAGAIQINAGVTTAQTVNTAITTNGAFSLTNNGGGLLTTAGTIALTVGNPLTVGGTGNVTLSGAVNGSAGLTKNGAGVLTMGTNNGYTGVTTINGGVISFVNTGRLGGGGVGNTIAINNGGTLRNTSSSDTQNITANRAIAIGTGGGVLEMTNSAGVLTIPGAVTGISTSLSKGGAGGIVLSGDNSGFTGGSIAVNAGTLVTTTNTGLGVNTAVTISNTTDGGTGTGTSLRLRGSSVGSDVSLVLNSEAVGDFRTSLVSETSGSSAWNGPITLQGTGSTQFYTLVSGQTFTINGDVTGINPGGSILTLRGNTASASGVINGTINLGASGAFGKTDSSTWTINSSGNTWGTSTLTSGILKIGVDDALPTNAVLQMGSNNNAPTFDLSGKNQTVANLTFTVGTGTRTITNTSGTAANFTVNNAVDGAYSGANTVITGNLSLTKTGLGSLIVGGTTNNTYVGTTDVKGGALLVNGTHLGGGLYTVDLGATLGGTGLIDADVTINGTLAPGPSIDSLDIDGNLDLNGLLAIEFDSVADSIDLLTVTGEINLTGATIDFSELNPTPVLLDQPAYVFASYGTLVGDPAAEMFVPAGYRVEYHYNNGIDSNHIALVPVPEPSAWSLIVVGGVGAWRSERKRWLWFWR